MSFTKSIVQFVDATLIDLARSFRFSVLFIRPLLGLSADLFRYLPHTYSLVISPIKISWQTSSGLRLMCTASRLSLGGACECFISKSHKNVRAWFARCSFSWICILLSGFHFYTHIQRNMTNLQGSLCSSKLIACWLVLPLRGVSFILTCGMALQVWAVALRYSSEYTPNCSLSSNWLNFAATLLYVSILTSSLHIYMHICILICI